MFAEDLKIRRIRTIKSTDMKKEKLFGKNEEKRFRVDEEQGLLTNYRIIVDNETGVNYLFVACGEAGGITPLLDKDGKPIVTPVYLD
jgi:hypothetical protein